MREFQALFYDEIGDGKRDMENPIVKWKYKFYC